MSSGSKRRTRPDGAEYGSQKFSRGALYLILQNRLYHKGNIYPGEHPATVDKPLWDGVQSVLAQTGLSGQRERVEGTQPADGHGF